MINPSFIPKINCRFKIRKDIDCHIGFFQTKGVLTFNDIGAFIVNQMIGNKSIQEIADSISSEYSDIENPLEEVVNIVSQFQDSGFL
ncbi:MAG: PqqD family protein [bacterium]